MGKIHHRRKAF